MCAEPPVPCDVPVMLSSKDTQRTAASKHQHALRARSADAAAAGRVCLKHLSGWREVGAFEGSLGRSCFGRPYVWMCRPCRLNPTLADPALLPWREALGAEAAPTPLRSGVSGAVFPSAAALPVSLLVCVPPALPSVGQTHLSICGHPEDQGGSGARGVCPPPGQRPLVGPSGRWLPSHHVSYRLSQTPRQKPP